MVMAAPVTLELDSREFQRVLERYTQLNRRDRATLVNNKAKDLMFTAAGGRKKAGVDGTPIGSRSKISPLAKNWPLRTWLGVRAGATTRKDRAEASAKILKGRQSSVGFMRSGFVKAGIKYRATLEARPGAVHTPPRAATRNRNSTSTVSNARPGLAPTATYELRWGERSGDPQGEAWKSRTLVAALARSGSVVAADMMKYVERKETQNARAVGLAVRRALT
jgi:hypothetical protein